MRLRESAKACIPVTDIAGPPQLQELVRTKVASGLYRSASEVVREARLMNEQDRLRAAKLEQLRDDIRQGLKGGPSKA